MLAAQRLSTEDLLYAAEAARPGSVVDLALAPGETMALFTPSAHGKRRALTHLVEDEMAIALVPARGRALRVILTDANQGQLWPLDIVLPHDVAVALIKPNAGHLSMRPHPKLSLIISQEEPDR